MVDQILISWSDRTLTDGRGVGPTGSSIGSKEELAGWERRLLAAEWAAAEVGAGAPGPALVYLQFGDEAAVLHKEPAADPHGRPGSTLAHALVGHVSVLDARVALGLHEWSGWAREGTARPGPLGGLGRLDGHELRRIAWDGYQRLDASARQLDPDVLSALFATLLSDPAGRFSFYPADQASGGLGGDGLVAARLLCGVLRVLGNAMGQAWTFSTCEAEEPAAATRPRLVFLSQAPRFSTHVPTGNRARIGELTWFGEAADEDGPDVLQTFGETLAETFAWSPETIERLRPAAPVRSTREAIFWASHAELAPGVPADFGNVLLIIGRGRTEPEVLDRLPSRPDVLAAGVRVLSEEMFTRLAGLWAPGTSAAASNPEVAEALGGQIAWRFVSEVQPPAADLVTRFEIQLPTWLEQLARYQSEFGAARVPAAARRVAALGVPGLESGLVRVLADAPAAELLALADEWAGDQPELSAQLLGVVAGRDHMPEPDRIACCNQLDQRTFMVSCVERCFPNDPVAESEVLRRLLSVIVAPGLHRPADVERLLPVVSPIRSAPLLHALARSVPPALGELVAAAAGDIWFEENGLPRLAVEAPPHAGPPAVVPDAPPGPADQAGPDAATGAAAAAPPPEEPTGRGRFGRWWSGLTLVMAGLLSLVLGPSR
ncbi:MAG TPA: hypothetical protein VGS06_41095 [Streptosporangiaceae bacterium]|nr:hypothetical protein [Streptosporangiaceae bacterium]